MRDNDTPEGDDPVRKNGMAVCRPPIPFEIDRAYGYIFREWPKAKIMMTSNGLFLSLDVGKASEQGYIAIVRDVCLDHTVNENSTQQGFFAVLGSELSCKAARLLVDHKHETGGVFVEKIIILKKPNGFQVDFIRAVTFLWILEPTADGKNTL